VSDTRLYEVPGEHNPVFLHGVPVCAGDLVGIGWESCPGAAAIGSW